MPSRAEELFERIEADGPSALEKLLGDRIPEQPFLDYKRSAGQGNGSVLHSSDSKNLSKAVSGFGNTEGGVLVWGVEKDLRLAGISDAPAFRVQLEEATSRASIPHHPGVRHHHWRDSSGLGFAATLVPKAQFAPILATAGGNTYYIRAGESFAPITHDALAGLFGRAPISVLWPRLYSYPMRMANPSPTDVVLTVGIALLNPGPLMVERPYVTIVPSQGRDERVRLGVAPIDDSRLRVHESSRGSFQVVAPEDVLIAPGWLGDICTIHWVLKPPLSGFIDVEITLGAKNVAPIRIGLQCDAARLRDGYAATIRNAGVNHGPDASAALATSGPDVEIVKWI